MLCERTQKVPAPFQSVFLGSGVAAKVGKPCITHLTVEPRQKLNAQVLESLKTGSSFQMFKTTLQSQEDEVPRELFRCPGPAAAALGFRQSWIKKGVCEGNVSRAPLAAGG